MLINIVMFVLVVYLLALMVSEREDEELED